MKLGTPSQEPELPDGWKRKPPRGYESLDDSKCNLRAVDEVISLLREKYSPVYIHGATGRGKSFLAARVFVGVSLWPNWYRYGDFVDGVIRSSKGDGVAGWLKIEEAKLLIIDEIGIGAVTEWKNEIMWKILELRKDRPTVLTGNIKPTELTKIFDARIASRIVAGSLVEVDGHDLRAEWINNKDELSRRVIKVGNKP